MDLKFYRNYPDLSKLNNINIMKHWKHHGNKEHRIGSKGHFLKLYPKFNLQEYKSNCEITYKIDDFYFLNWHHYDTNNYRNSKTDKNKIIRERTKLLQHCNNLFNNLNKNNISIETTESFQRKNKNEITNKSVNTNTITTLKPQLFSEKKVTLKDVDFSFYKEYQDLKKMTGRQLSSHWMHHGQFENRLYSKDHFYSIYPYFDIDRFKLLSDKKYNNDNSIIIDWYHNGDKKDKRFYSNIYNINNNNPKFEIFKQHTANIKKIGRSIRSQNVKMKKDNEDNIKIKNEKMKNEKIKNKTNNSNVIAAKSSINFKKKLYNKKKELENRKRIEKKSITNKIHSKINLTKIQQNLIDDQLFDINFYKKYWDLSHMNVEQLINHWSDIGQFENRLGSVKHFNILYPNFNLNLFKNNCSEIYSEDYYYYIKKHNNQKEKKEYSINNNLEENKNCDEFGFIMVRHITNAKTAKYWLEYYNSIRKYYNNKIVIIDDNSNPLYVKEYDNLVNVEFINAEKEFQKRAELLPYYYFYKYKFFKKAVITHDSVFFRKKIDFEDINSIQFLWHFKLGGEDIEYNELKFIDKLDKKTMVKELYNDKSKWVGCFGIQSVITLDFINILQSKYNFFNLLNYVTCRKDRMCIERVFAVLCFLENENLKKKPSMFGIIHDYLNWGYSYREYKRDDLIEALKDFPIIKVWTGR